MLASSAFCGLALVQSALALRRSTKKHVDEMGGAFTRDPASRTADWTCDVDCVKAAALAQGADVLTGLGNLKYSMEVEFSAGADSGEACGASRRFPAFSGVRLNPAMPLRITTAQTRSEPEITFACEDGKSYHMILHDSLGGAFQSVQSYTHWMKLNMDCSGGLARVAGNGVDMNQGTGCNCTALPCACPAVTLPAGLGGGVWFGGAGYLYPAFPYNSFHHFNFHIFEAAAPFDAARIAAINGEFPARNQLGNAWNLSQLMEWLELGDPVARTWMDVTTSYWSMVRMAPLAALYGPGFADSSFMQLQCPCNLPENSQGVNVTGDAEKAALVARCAL